MLSKSTTAKTSYFTQFSIVFILSLFIGFSGMVLHSPAQAKSTSQQTVKNEKAQVIILTASWCGYCNKLRQYLQSNQIKFTEYDIEQSHMGYQLYRSLGGKGIPVVKIGNNVIYGYNPDAMKQVLNESGYNLP